MDAPSFENLRSFFDRVKNAGFFERLFSWKAIAAAGYDAYAEFQKLQAALAETTARLRDLGQAVEHQKEQSARVTQELAAERGQGQALAGRLSEREQEAAKLAEALANSEDAVLRLKGELVALGAKNEDLLRRINDRENEAGGLIAADRKNRELIQKLNADVAALNARYDQLNLQYTEAQKVLAEVRQAEGGRIREHDARVVELTTLKKQLEEDRLRVQAERDEEIRCKYEAMEQTWRKHEEEVEATIKAICQRHTLEYCDKEKFPIAGKKPDNAIVIADQYVVFDAKSPKNSDELGNFPLYIRNQAEAAKKYAKEENVKKDIFLVVPANTVEYLDEFHLDMADYQVYVVTHECLEPVVLALRKIEDYEFAEQLSPDDRENICHVIGRFAHATKRRIQIDNYFSNEFIRLLQGCNALPDEILEKVVDYEKAEKMNPPMEKRNKLIPLQKLEHEVKEISKEAEAREIDVTAVTRAKIETIPLDKFLE